MKPNLHVTSNQKTILTYLEIEKLELKKISQRRFQLDKINQKQFFSNLKTQKDFFSSALAQPKFSTLDNSSKTCNKSAKIIIIAIFLTLNYQRKSHVY